jgi:hypothetical protein
VEELAKSLVAKISISSEPDLRGPVGAPSGNHRYLRIPAVRMFSAHRRDPAIAS